jgi:hypothetical protein
MGCQVLFDDHNISLLWLYGLRIVSPGQESFLSSPVKNKVKLCMRKLTVFLVLNMAIPFGSIHPSHYDALEYTL